MSTAFAPIVRLKQINSPRSIIPTTRRRMKSSIFTSSQDLNNKAAAAFWKNVFEDGHRGHTSIKFDGIPFKEPIHFNNAGASPSPPSVLQAVAKHTAKEALLGGYLAASIAQPEVDKVYSSVACLLNAKCIDNAKQEIALVESATVAGTRIFYSMVETLARQAEKTAASHDTILERVILVSEAEYAANVVAAVKFALEQNERIELTNVRWRVLSIPSTSHKNKEGEVQSSGILDLTVLDDMLAGRWKLEGDVYLDPNSIVMVCITHIPTNSGIINPVNAIGELISKHNNNPDNVKSPLPKCFYLVDACQSAGQIQLDVQKMHCHALTATGRKYLRGPRGTGFLYVKQEIANAIEPSHVDHASTPVKSLPRQENNDTASAAGQSLLYLSVDLTEQLEYGYQPGAARFEFWESNIAGKLGLGAAVNYAIDEVGMDVIETKCCTLGDMLRSQLRNIDGVKVYHDNHGSEATKQCGIVVFSVDGIEPSKIKELLIGLSSEFNETTSFEVSVVPATSTPVDSAKTCATDLIRASVSYLNTEEEICLFCDQLTTIIHNEHH